MDVTIRNYGEGMTPRANTIAVQAGAIEYYFSYRTLVAFHAPSTGLVVRKNDWGATTGKHLNWIDGGAKSDRLDANAFQVKLVGAIADEQPARRVYLTADSVKALVDGKSVQVDSLELLPLSR